jgi:hypothetical protein
MNKGIYIQKKGQKLQKLQLIMLSLPFPIDFGSLLGKYQEGIILGIIAAVFVVVAILLLLQRKRDISG